MKNTFLFVLLLILSRSVNAQQHKMSEEYVAPKDPLVQTKLREWQDLKFGLFMHWGTYSQWGVVESWSICPEDEPWEQRKGPHGNSYAEYKQAYEQLQTTFNPTKFNPEKWVEAAGYAGMKYVIFTTKHHDGFCMFDTRQTDYSITNSKTPFSKNPRSNVTKEIFNAFRKDSFLVGTYFSKPDWHNENYWWPYFPPKDRHVNYNPAKYPERWTKFKDYTFNQINELMSDYGKIDVLWLDGGWVRPQMPDSMDLNNSSKYNQDIDMAKIAASAREKQPGLIVVDRTVAGEFENYTTPEQQIPDTPLSHPWESCITMGNSWSYVPGDHYKSTAEIISLLIKIVSRGGNLLMNIGPGPDGDWDPQAYDRLKEIGDWIKVNGDGIYGTNAIAPYSEGNLFYTQAAKQQAIYAFQLAEKGKDIVSLPATLTMHLPDLKKIKRINLNGSRAKLRWTVSNDAVVLTIPKNLQGEKGSRAAVGIRVQY